ncbi:myo-inosose-2 dehydratase [Halioxenophilus aromaticivorans]|uniref:Myo-inosose-2 dehydratase n=1 Tax=Halioxenophilus aromaticivorans TaxID=1306992 RepID=A0AAV3TWZ2_9ALTE
MSVQLGINPLTWTNDDLASLGAETSIEQCLSEGKQAGFAGFELGHKFPRQADHLVSLLNQYDLKPVSGWYSTQLLKRSVEEEIAAGQGHLALLRDSGCKVMVTCEVTGCVHGNQKLPVSHRPQLSQQQWSQLSEKLTEFASYTQSQGVQVAYHHHMGTVVQSADEVDRLMSATGPEVGLLLDTGHLTYDGSDPLAVAQRWIERINHVHCKDIRANVLKDALNRDLSFLDSVLNGVFTVPGDGCVDYPAIFDVLKQANYRGWLVVEAEQDPAIANPLTYATLGFSNLQRMASEAGLI